MPFSSMISDSEARSTRDGCCSSDDVVGKLNARHVCDSCNGFRPDLVGHHEARLDLANMPRIVGISTNIGIGFVVDIASE